MAFKDLLKLYGYYLSNFISRGSLVNRDAMSSLAIRSVHSKFLTRKGVTKVWIIRSLPVHFPYNLSTLVREEMHQLFPAASTRIHTVSNRIIPPVEKDIFKKQYAREEERYQDLKQAFDEMTPAQREAGVKLGGGFYLRIRKRDLEKQKGKFDSYHYVSTHTNRGGSFFKTNLFIQASGPDMKYMDRYRDALEKLLRLNDIEFEEVGSSMNHYLDNYSPAAYIQDERKRYTKNLFSDTNLAQILPTNVRGLVGGKGVLFGLDWLSKQPLILNMFKESTAQVFLLLGMAGSGKTLAAEFLTLSLQAIGVHANIVDYKGGEYEKLSFVVDPLVIDLDGDTAPFVNILRLDDVPVDETNCAHMYNLAIIGAVELFSIISNINPENAQDVEDAFKEAITKSYSSLSGFNPLNPATFSRTKDMSYLDVVEVLAEVAKSDTYQYIRPSLDKAVSKLRVFFTGFLSGDAKEITLSDVINSPTVIYSMNKNTSTTISLRDSVQVFMMQMLSRKKHFVRANQGLFTLEIYEELTRVEESATAYDNTQFGKRLLLFISQVVTGARSDNVIVFLLANNLMSLKSPVMRPVTSNISTVIAGKLAEDDIPLLVKTFRCSGIEDYVRQISSGDPKFKHCFAIRFDNGDRVEQAMYKAIFPSDMEEALRQRDVLDL